MVIFAVLLIVHPWVCEYNPYMSVHPGYVNITITCQSTTCAAATTTTTTATTTTTTATTTTS